LDYSPTRISVSVRAGAPAFLLLTDAYYPGWTATVNGEPVDVRRADVMFRAVPVPAGESIVIFEYRPAWLPAVLIAGGMIWLLAVLWAAARFRRMTTTQS
jgi:uncharacterized membrane protein YfhO